MKVQFDAIAAAKLPNDMMQVTISSKGKDGKEKPFQTFYVTLGSNYLAPLHAAARLVPWAADTITSTVRSVVRDAAAAAKLSGANAVDLADNCEIQLALSRITVNLTGTKEWLETVAIPAKLKADGKTLPADVIATKAKEIGERFHNFPAIERIAAMLELINSYELDDAYSLAMVQECAIMTEQLTALEDDLGLDF